MPDKELFYTEYFLWRDETWLRSHSLYDSVHFDNIVKMGEKAAPYLLELLNEGPNHIVHACDLIYPGEVTYEGYIPLDFACKTWATILTAKLNGQTI